MGLRSRLIDRDDELERLRAHFIRAKEGDGNLLFIEGEAGVGKTRLVEEFLTSIGKDTINYLFGRGLHGGAPYLPFSKALSSIGEAEGIIGSGVGRVTQIFLVHSTSVLINHQSSDLDPVLDADLVGGVLATIQTFIRDSRKAASKSVINELRAGDNTVLIESSRNIYLAAVIDGKIEESFRATIRQMMNLIEGRFGNIAKTWEGDPDAFRGVGQLLAHLLSERLDFRAVNPAEKREKIFEKVLRIILALARSKPVVFFLDDVQWVDPASLELLHYLVKNTHTTPVFFIGTFRPEDLDDIPGSGASHPLTAAIRKLGSERLYSRVKLKRLSKDGVNRMIEAMFPENTFSLDLITAIHQESDGNPFFIEEIMASLIEEGVIFSNRESWASRNFTELQLPATVQDVIMRRVERLDGPRRKIIEYGSVVGLEFPFDILETVMAIDEDELLVFLDDLIKYKLIVEIGDERYGFEHTTIQEVVYKSLSATILKVLHRKCGLALEEYYGAKARENSFELFRHFTNTRDHKRAYQYATFAGSLARDRSDIIQALTYLEGATLLIPKVFDGDDEAIRRIDNWIAIAECNYQIGRFGAAQSILVKCEVLAKESEDNLRYSNVMRLSGHCEIGLGDFSRAEAYYHQAWKGFEEFGAIRGVADALKGIGYCHWRRGEVDEAAKWYDRALGMAVEIADKNLQAVISIEYGNLFTQVGKYEEARDQYHKAIVDLREQKDFAQLARALNNLGDSFLITEDWEEAIKVFAECMEVARQFGNRVDVAWGLFNSAQALTNLGELEQAESYCQQAKVICEEHGDSVGLSGTEANLARIYRMRGERDIAIQYHESGLKILQELEIPYDIATATLSLAETHLHFGEVDLARKVLEDNLRFCKEMDFQILVDNMSVLLSRVGQESPQGFIGLTDVLQGFKEEINRSYAGNGRMTIGSGEPGSGKTFLFETLLGQQDVPDFWRIFGDCHPDTKDIPLYPFTQAFERFFGDSSNIIPGVKRVLENAPSVVTEMIPLYASTRSDDWEPEVVESPGDQRTLIFDSLCEIIIELTKEKFLILDLANIHWIDPTSMQFIHYLCRNRGNAPVYIAASLIPTLETSHVRSTLQLMNRERLIREITFHPFDIIETTSFITGTLPGWQIEEDVIVRIHERTNGNPGLIRFYLNHLKGTLEEEIITTTTLEEAAIPVTMMEALNERIQALEDDLIPLLVQCSCIGDVFAFGDIERIFGYGEDDLSEGLQGLIRRGVIGEISGEMYTFTPPALRDVVYSLGTSSQLLANHSRILEWLEGDGQASTPDVFRLARHANLAGVPLKAISYDIMAYEQARSSFAHTEALDYILAARQAANQAGLEESDPDRFMEISLLCLKASEDANRIEIIPELTESYSRIANQQGIIPHLCQAMRYKAKVLERKGDIFGSKKILIEGYNLALTFPDEELRALMVSDLVKVLQGIDLQGSFSFAEKYVQHAMDCESETIRSQALVAMGVQYWLMGKFEKAIEYNNQAIEAITNPANEYLISEPTMRRALNLAELSQNEKSIEDFLNALAISTKFNRVSSIARCQANLAEAFFVIGKYKDAKLMIDESTKFYKRVHDVGMLSNNFMVIGMITGKLGDVKIAEEYFIQSLGFSKESKDRDHEAQTQFQFARMLRDQGDVIRAEKHYSEANGIWKDLGNPTKASLALQEIEDLG